MAVGIRAVGWSNTALKAYLRGDVQAALLFLSTCATSGLLPVFGLLLSHKTYISNLRPFWVAAANMMQFLQVGKFYDYLYPCTGSGCDENLVPRSRAIIALFSSNGAAFLIMTAFMGSLTFKWLFITQCVYSLILIVNNRSICSKGPALRSGYQLVNQFFSTLTQHVWPFSTVDRLQSAHEIFKLESSVQQCVKSQIAMQLIFGLWLPCWVAYSRELQARKLFVRSRRGEAAYAYVIFPSSWEMFIYALPAVAFFFNSVFLYIDS